MLSTQQQHRRISCRIVAALSITMAALCSTACAQQFFVYTKVTSPPLESASANAEPEVLARSLTLFHAGRVFDWLPDVGEVSIFEPTHRRFIIFHGRLRSGNKNLATTVTFDEITRLLDSARDETTSYAKRLEKQNDLETRAIVEPLKFQLRPAFTEKYDDSTQRLSLSSARFSYMVECGEAEIPEAIEAYIEYADWLARLNYVLGPGRMFPEPRLTLNKSLREHNVIPINVQLRVDFDQPMRLEASHQFGWQIDATNRARINDWETQLRDAEWVTFREYQRAILKATATVGS